MIRDKGKTGAIKAIFTAAVLVTSGAGIAADEYQYRVLFSPSKDNLEWEAPGRVMIYDGLENSAVVRAMDEQFGRIENMMFVRTVYTQEDGEIEVEEDGCD